MKKVLDFLVKENIEINHDIFMLTLHSGEMPECKPGQFVNVLIDNSKDTFLRRPISIHDVDSKNGLLYLLVKIAGKGTKQLSKIKAGEKLNVLLPLGNGFNTEVSGKCLLVGGGVGIAPLYHLSKELKKKGLNSTILIGTRTINDVVLKDKMSQYAEVLFTTEDGSFGEKGYPTNHSILQNKFDHIFVCGPLPMMKAVAKYAKSVNCDCQVSLENMMACGLGACLCCVTETKDGHNKCVCTEGPVFNINDLTWQI